MNGQRHTKKEQTQTNNEENITWNKKEGYNKQKQEQEIWDHKINIKRNQHKDKTKQTLNRMHTNDIKMAKTKQ